MKKSLISGIKSTKISLQMIYDYMIFIHYFELRED